MNQVAASRKISIAEIVFHPRSLTDPAGRTFYWDSDLYRGVREPWCEHVLKLLQDPLITSLQSKGDLVQAAVTELTLYPEFPLVLKVQEISPIVHPFEWCDAAVKDIALFVLEFAKNLSSKGYIPWDAHGWNIALKNTGPCWIDIGSIVALDNNHKFSKFLELFSSNFMGRLRFIETDRGKIARALISYSGSLKQTDLPPLSTTDFIKESGKKLLRSLIPKSKIWRARNWVYNQKYPSNSSNFISSLELLTKKVQDIKLPTKDTKWSTYRATSKKIQMLGDILAKIQKGSLLDIGANTGTFSLLAASYGHDVVAIDSDERSVSILYEASKKRNLKILPVVGDIIKSDKVEERFAADTVLFLGTIHHLVVYQGIPIYHLLDRLSRLTKKILILELITFDDPIVLQSGKDGSQLIREVMLSQLSLSFDLVKEVKNTPSRSILVFKKK